MLWFNSSDNTVITVDSLYKYTKAQNITLFPTENYDFWQPYEANYAKFDRYFYQKFRAFKVGQEYPNGTTVGDMLTDWKQIIDAHLFINQKRYSELYRVQVLANDAYDIVNNYDLHEVAQRKNTGTQTDALGARQDSTERGAGTVSTQYGQQEHTNQYGARTDSNTTTLGRQVSDNTQTRSAFNSNSLQDVAGGSITNGQREDSAQLQTGAHTDTLQEAQHTDTVTEAARTDTTNIGAQSNQRTDNLQEDSTLHRYGNIGVQTAAEIIAGHQRLWDAFRFYQMIFDEIAEEYLVIDVDFDFGGSTASSGGGGGGGGDAELLAAIQALSEQLTAAQASINGNVDSSESTIRTDIAALSSKTTQDTTNIRSDIAALSTKTTGDTAAIRSDIASSTANIRGDIVEVTTDGY